tara:strand:+ start:2479 stop:3063 length:585 start_codon:yes stop_codon:yes gene_type:complete
MEKFQNFLNSIGGNLNKFRKNVGFTKEGFGDFMNYLAPSPGESANPSVNEGILTPPTFVKDTSRSLEDIVKSGGVLTDKEGGTTVLGENKKKGEIVTGNKDESKVPSFDDIMGIGIKDYISEVAKVGERAKDKDALRSGISSLAYSPLIGSQAAMDAAANISQLTGVNMAAIANQGSVMASNPTKQRIAGKYFR